VVLEHFVPVGDEETSSSNQVIPCLHIPGRFLNYYYRQTVQKLSNGNGRSFNGHEPDFPIEKTRLKGAYMLILVSGLGTLGYGLALMTRTVSHNFAQLRKSRVH
jgi:hypothetical protein